MANKAPSIQFYVRDWLCDPELRSASLLSRGAWIDCLCFMWENSQRGELTRTPIKFARLISGSLDEALHFLNELYEYEFGDIETEDDIEFPLTLENCNAKVTIRNRRMYADYKDKQNTRLRVRKHREKKNKPPKKQKCNTDVTLTSSTSSSITTTKKKNIKKKKNFIKPYLGEFQNVKLTQDEFDKLDCRYEDAIDKIENLSMYIKSKGDKYKDHYATILMWARKDEPKGKGGLLKPTTYAQAQDLERRTMVKMLKDMENEDDETGDRQRVNQASHLLSHGKEVD